MSARNKRYGLEFNWGFRHTCLLFLIVFGFYGWGTTSGLSHVLDKSNLLTTITLIFCSFFLFLRRFHFDSLFKKPIRIDFGFLLTSLTFLALGILLNMHSLTRPLTVDEAAYSWFSQLHAYVLVLKIAPYLPNLIIGQNSGIILHLLSFLMIVAGGGLLIFLFKIQKDTNFFASMLFITLMLRMAVQYFGGTNGPNSPLPSLWYFVTSSFFGPYNVTYRLSSLLLFCFLAAYLYRQLSSVLLSNRLIAFLTTLMLFSIPLVSAMSIIIEIANWSFFISVILFVELIRNNFRVNEIALIILALSFYLRVNVITLLLTLFLYLIITNFREMISERWRYVYPLCIILPGLVPVATGRLMSRLSSEESFFTIVRRNLHNSFDALSLSGGSWYLVLAVGSLFLLILKRQSRKFILLLLFFDFIVFIGLNSPSLTTSSKYIIEYFYPVVMIFGFLVSFENFRQKKFFIHGAVFALLMVNIYGLHAKSQIPDTFAKVYDPVQGAISSAYSVIPFTPFPYIEAFRFVEKEKLNPCFNSGVVYSVFPEILEGLPLSEVADNYQIRQVFLQNQVDTGEVWTTLSHDSLVKSGISCVIVGAVEDQGIVVKNLETSGWAVAANFIDRTYGTRVFIMTNSK